MVCLCVHCGIVRQVLEHSHMQLYPGATSSPFLSSLIILGLDRQALPSLFACMYQVMSAVHVTTFYQCAAHKAVCYCAVLTTRWPVSLLLAVFACWCEPPRC